MISGKKLVLPHRGSVLGLDALLGDSRTDHLRQSVYVERDDPEAGLEFVSEFLGPGLGSEDADLQRAPGRVRALAFHLVDQVQAVAGGHEDDPRAEVANQRHLSLGLAAGHGHDGASEQLGAVVSPQPAREEPVAVGNVGHVAGSAARRMDRASHHPRPRGDVHLGVAHDRRLAGRAGRGLQPDDLGQRDCEHAEGIAASEVVLRQQRETGEVLEALEVARVRARGGERLPIVRHVVVRVAKHPPQADQLQRPEVIDRDGLDGVDGAHVVALDCLPGARENLLQ